MAVEFIEKPLFLGVGSAFQDADQVRAARQDLSPDLQRLVLELPGLHIVVGEDGAFFGKGGLVDVPADDTAQIQGFACAVHQAGDLVVEQPELPDGQGDDHQVEQHQETDAPVELADDATLEESGGPSFGRHSFDSSAQAEAAHGRLHLVGDGG